MGLDVVVTTVIGDIALVTLASAVLVALITTLMTGPLLSLIRPSKTPPPADARTRTPEPVSDGRYREAQPE